MSGGIWLTMSYLIALFCINQHDSLAFVPEPTTKVAPIINYRAKPKPPLTVSSSSWKIPESVHDQFLRPDLSLPLTIPINAAGTINTDNSQSSQPPTRLTLRLLQTEDIPQILDLCINEYGRRNGPPCWSQLSWPVLLDYLDDLTLKPLVESSLRIKLLLQQQTPSSRQSAIPIPNDHAVLVLEATTLEETALSFSSKSDSNGSNTIVGMIEVSRQPVLPERNPPAFPIPLWIKRLWSYTLVDNNNIREPQGWISNLLVAPHYRQHGCARLLVRACEAIAAQVWQCQSIHLHCDAHPQRGKPSQALYRDKLNYQTLAEVRNYYVDDEETSNTRGGGLMTTTKKIYATARANTLNGMSRGSGEPVMEGPEAMTSTSSIFIIEGVPLLYLQKQL